ncbi:hypothetical protein GALMADRAFT_223841 [Galerina marginata CBS 339.88]|uniref:Uncharacterized protein n=1 Tax=Galerina marginata (strain CBS 339.88) TaxID=685588 RepID=A0A067T884_GALM3|nr:hypothetical protein GALMADRAFT_223841 [Galerina marginata CBS 339.88]
MTCSSSKPLRLCPDLILDPKLEIAYTFYLSKDEPSSMRSINQIPVEMLREIFAKFVEIDCSELCSASKPESPESSGSTEGTMGPATGLADPTILGQVCSYWRHVALSTPFLWSTICIIPDTKHLVAQINWTAMFLMRAGTSPLDLSLKDCRCRSAVSTQSVRPSICHSAALAPSASPTICAMRTFLSLFVSRIQYWRSIDFHLPPEAVDVLFSITNSPSLLKCDTLCSASVLISRTNVKWKVSRDLRLCETGRDRESRGPHETS